MLTDAAAKNAKPKAKVYRLADSHGLCLEIKPSGSKHWRYRYRFQGKANMLSLGEYPLVSLAKARKKCDEARELLSDGIDPSQERKAEKKERERQARTFKDVGEEWVAKKSQKWTALTIERNSGILTRYLYPEIGDTPIADIEPPELLTALRKMESRGIHESAKRAHQLAGSILGYGVASGYCTRNSATDLKGALTPPDVTHFASITDPRNVAPLLRSIDGYSGQLVTKCALRLAPLVFARPGELRHAEWLEIDFDAAEWRIPAEKMKKRRPHIVPLSRQALDILQELHHLTGEGKYLFPSLRTTSRPISENTINAALRRMGFDKSEMTGHGFRSMASTILHEQGWPSDVVERQLAHIEGNSVKAAYNYAEHLPERRRMMQSWADYLDGLKAGARVTPLRSKSG
ncbi:tyrosine-type recombinase/integrase [Oceanidesulfovibrio marinus]|uniref:DUF4102 domain-containing protein n=1 Tax=Oceanidesulfovibrio marinus TaxID=370038 RepID=A0ABX6NI87_9BACT|nr:integrase arm-type DNA-binding domain-containing protein [Oceanidesulfovibrio marinus]QJT09410.1 DUF4102 domain-containing protein [Oceanidesulfovibrio marinus]